MRFAYFFVLNKLATYGKSLNTKLYNTSIEEWDYKSYVTHYLYFSPRRYDHYNTKMVSKLT